MFNRFFKSLLWGLMFFSLIAAGARPCRNHSGPRRRFRIAGDTIPPSILTARFTTDLSAAIPALASFGKGRLTNPTMLDPPCPATDTEST